MERDPDLEGPWVRLVISAAPAPHPSLPSAPTHIPLPPSPLLSAQLGHCQGLQRGCVQGMAVPPGILGISPFSTSCGNAGRRALESGLQSSGSWPCPGGQGGFEYSSKGEGLFLTPLTRVLSKNVPEEPRVGLKPPRVYSQGSTHPEPRGHLGFAQGGLSSELGPEFTGSRQGSLFSGVGSR